MRSSLETPFAAFTLSTALVHFTGETYYHVMLGQPLPSYIVDLISISLMLLGATASLWNRTRSAAGWLVAAWGFAFCLNYRSFFWRWQELQAEGAILNGEPDAVIKILGVTLTVAALSFIVAMFLAKPTKGGNA